MEEKNYAQRVRIPEEYLDEIVIQLVANGKIGNLLSIIANQIYVISPVMIETLIRFGYKEVLNKILKFENVIYNKDIYYILCEHWGKENAEKFLIENGYDTIVEELISEESLIAHRRWDVLLKRTRFEILLANKQYELVFNCSLGMARLTMLAYSQLPDEWLEKCCADRKNIVSQIYAVENFIKASRFATIISYLAGAKRWEEVYKILEKTKFKQERDTVFELYTRSFYDAGYKEVPYKVGKIQIYINNRDWPMLIWAREYDAVDWDAYYQEVCAAEKSESTKDVRMTRTAFIHYAYKAKRKDVLRKYGMRMEVWKKYREIIF